MAELSPEARALLEDGLYALRPSRDDRTRVASRLAERLSEGALITRYAAGAVQADAVPWHVLATLVGGLGILAAAGAYHWLSPVPASVPPAPRSFASLTSPQLPTLAPSASESPALLPPAGEDGASPPPPRAPTSDGLAAEVSILSRAASELRSGHPRAALLRLEEHRRRFPSGRLVEERRAARVQALCALGNRAEAEVELARLTRTSPRSLHVVRARHACRTP